MNLNFSSILGGFNWTDVISKIYFFVGLFFLMIILGGIIGGWLYYRAKKKEVKDFKKIQWWEEIAGRLIPTRSELVEEIIIPGSTLKVFYKKETDLWLPRFTRGITPDLFFVAMTPNRQMINFTLKSISQELATVGLDFDHTDMLWAAENTREFIKRNYKDKSVKWWQAYQQVIAVAILILVMTFSFVLIIYMLKGVVDKIGILLDVANQANIKSCAAAFNTGTSSLIPA